MNTNNTQLVPVPGPGEVAQASFGETAMERQCDLAVRAMAKQAESQIQARYIMAERKPRDVMQARERILRDCQRPAFAKKAIYHKPIGQGVEGPSIRLAEALARAMTNILTDVSAIYDDPQKRIVRVVASDLESNITFTKDVTVNKTVERSKPIEGRKIVSQRVNSKGYPVFVLEATDDEILDRENALASKAMRTCLLRLIPGDVLEEAMDRCYQTQATKDAEDPDATRKAMVDAFGGINVSVEQLAAYLGHPLEQTVPKEMQVLRGIFNAIKDGEATWAEAIASRDGGTNGNGKSESSAQQEPSKADAPKGQTTLGDVAARSKAGREKGKERQPGEDD